MHRHYVATISTTTKGGTRHPFANVSMLLLFRQHQDVVEINGQNLIFLSKQKDQATPCLREAPYLLLRPY